MGKYYKWMSDDMGCKLSGYYYSLQNRFGDPRVYAAQRQQILKQEERVQYDKHRQTSELLKNAYAERAEKNRKQHSDRLLKHRVGHTASQPPESARSATRRSSEQPKPAPSRD